MRQNILITRVVSCLTLASFLVSNFTFRPAFALEPSATPIAVLSGEFPSDPSLVKVPPEMGKIEDFSKGAAGGVVILIQDAHEIPDAQKNIQQLIDYFQTNYGVSLIGLEGASARLDPLIFKSFPDKERLKKVFKEYQEQGELAAGTGAAIFSAGGGPASGGGQREILFQGVEDWPLYEEGIGFYLKAMREEPRVFEKLKVWENQLKSEKEKIYSAELLEIDRTLENFYRNQGALLETLRKLAAVKAPSEGSELALILKEGETRAGEEALEGEVKTIARKVEAFLKTQTMTAEGNKKLAKFSARYQDFQTSRVTPKAFAVFLKKLTARDRLPFRISKTLSGSMREQKRMEQIKGTKFFEDFERYAEEAQDSLIQNEGQRRLRRESRELRIVERLAKLELTREDWEEIENIVSLRGGVPNNAEAISKSKENTPASEIASVAVLLRNDMKPHLAFYRNAEKRDAAMFQNLMRLMSSSGLTGGSKMDSRLRGNDKNTAILIAGGFHTEGLTRCLKEKGISYLRLMPNIESIPEETNYRAHMRGEVSWKKYLKAENGRINLYNAFVRGTRDRLLGSSFVISSEARNPGDFSPPGEAAPLRGLEVRNGIVANPRLLKSWRDQIILDLANQNKIEKAGEYTKFIDELSESGKKEKLKAEWMANIDRFLEGLSGLKSRNELNRENVLNLLKLSGAPTPYTSVGGQSVPGSTFLVTDTSMPILFDARSEARTVDFNDAQKELGEATGTLFQRVSSLITDKAGDWRSYKDLYNEIKGVLDSDTRDLLDQVWPQLRADRQLQLPEKDPFSILLGLAYAIVGQNFVRDLTDPAAADQRQESLFKYLNSLLEQYAAVDPDQSRGVLTPLWLIFIGLSPLVKGKGLAAYIHLSEKLRELPAAYRYRAAALGLILTGSHLGFSVGPGDAPDVKITAGDIQFALESLKREKVPEADKTALKLGLSRFLDGAKFLWNIGQRAVLPAELGGEVASLEKVLADHKEELKEILSTVRKWEEDGQFSLSGMSWEFFYHFAKKFFSLEGFFLDPFSKEHLKLWNENKEKMRETLREVEAHVNFDLEHKRSTQETKELDGYLASLRSEVRMTDLSAFKRNKIPKSDYTLDPEAFGGAGENLVNILGQAALPADPIIAIRGALAYAHFGGKVLLQYVSDFDIVFYLNPNDFKTFDSEKSSEDKMMNHLADLMSAQGLDVRRESVRQHPRLYLYNKKQAYAHYLSIDILPMTELFGENPLYNFNPSSQYFGSQKALKEFGLFVKPLLEDNGLTQMMKQYGSIYAEAAQLYQEALLTPKEENVKSLKRFSQLAFWLGREDDKLRLLKAHLQILNDLTRNGVNPGVRSKVLEMKSLTEALSPRGRNNPGGMGEADLLTALEKFLQFSASDSKVTESGVRSETRMNEEVDQNKLAGWKNQFAAMYGKENVEIDPENPAQPNPAGIVIRITLKSGMKTDPEHFRISDAARQLADKYPQYEMGSNFEQIVKKQSPQGEEIIQIIERLELKTPEEKKTAEQKTWEDLLKHYSGVPSEIETGKEEFEKKHSARLRPLYLLYAKGRISFYMDALAGILAASRYDSRTLRVTLEQIQAVDLVDPGAITLKHDAAWQEIGEKKWSDEEKRKNRVRIALELKQDQLILFLKEFLPGDVNAHFAHTELVLLSALQKKTALAMAGARSEARTNDTEATRMIEWYPQQTDKGEEAAVGMAREIKRSVDAYSANETAWMVRKNKEAGKVIFTDELLARVDQGDGTRQILTAMQFAGDKVSFVVQPQFDWMVPRGQPDEAKYSEAVPHNSLASRADYDKDNKNTAYAEANLMFGQKIPTDLIIFVPEIDVPPSVRRINFVNALILLHQALLKLYGEEVLDHLRVQGLQALQAPPNSPFTSEEFKTMEEYLIPDTKNYSLGRLAAWLEKQSGEQSPALKSEARALEELLKSMLFVEETWKKIGVLEVPGKGGVSYRLEKDKVNYAFKIQREDRSEPENAARNGIDFAAPEKEIFEYNSDPLLSGDIPVVEYGANLDIENQGQGLISASLKVLSEKMAGQAVLMMRFSHFSTLMDLADQINKFPEDQLPPGWKAAVQPIFKFKEAPTYEKVKNSTWFAHVNPFKKGAPEDFRPDFEKRNILKKYVIQFLRSPAFQNKEYKTALLNVMRSGQLVNAVLKSFGEGEIRLTVLESRNNNEPREDVTVFYVPPSQAPAPAAKSKVRADEKQAKLSRSEQREAKTVQGGLSEQRVSMLAGLLAPGEVRSELRFNEGDPAIITEDLLKVEIPLSEIAKALKEEVERLLPIILENRKAVEAAGKVSAVTPEQVRAWITHWMGKLAALSDKKYSLVVYLKKNAGPTQIKNTAEALSRFQDQIEGVFIVSDDRSSTQDITHLLKGNELFVSALKNLDLIKSTLFANQPGVPVIMSDDEKVQKVDDNPLALSIGLAGANDDPLLGLAASVLEVASSLSVLSELDQNHLQAADLKRSETRAEAVKAALIRELLEGYTAGAVFTFKQGHLSINPDALGKMMAEYRAAAKAKVSA